MTGDLVVVFARAPVAGAVKTRLARHVGDARALELYRWLGARVMAGLVLTPRSYRLRVAFTPDDAQQAVQAWLPGADDYVAQAAGDLGARMAAAIAGGIAGGFERVVIVGTDCLAVDAARLTAALSLLRGDAPCVLGPALDGGYYLIGATVPDLPVFLDMSWGTDSVLATTLARLRASGIRFKKLPVEQDIDTVDDLEALVGVDGAPPWLARST